MRLFSVSIPVSFAMSLFVLSLVVAGCGEPGEYARLSDANDETQYEFTTQSEAPFEKPAFVGMASKRAHNLAKVDNKPAGESESELETSDKTKDEAGGRKIIYTATMDVVVENFDGIEKKLTDLVSQYGGFVSSANLGRLRGERRSGTWQVRIPVQGYSNFLNGVGDIGIPTSRVENSSDVTEEFVDIQARIGNTKKLEERIIKLLERPDHKLQHVIEVERELSRVRESIERMEGRIRYLSDATSLTTVNIHVREERDFVPAQTPTLGKRIQDAWATSVANAQKLLENLVVAIVGNAIGFCIFAGSALLILIVMRTAIRVGKRYVESISAG